MHELLYYTTISWSVYSKPFDAVYPARHEVERERIAPGAGAPSSGSLESGVLESPLLRQRERQLLFLHDGGLLA
ncbi:MAG TPA: hypothetical protein VNN62_03025 [Methylomirabilota bacterium]|nr:hypothetical protein [Methylomirabilota bacterium]